MLAHLEVDVDVIPEHVHAEEPAPADLTGVLLVAVRQQVFVHVAPAGEHLWGGEPARRSLGPCVPGPRGGRNRAQKRSFPPGFELQQLLSVGDTNSHVVLES